MTKQMITIAIPTYDRNKELKATLDKLQTIFNGMESVKIVVLDNCSPNPVSLVDGGSTHPKIVLVNNPHNIGMSANISRCLEICETEWLWIMGDDDDISSDALVALRHAMAVGEDDPAVAWVHFQCTIGGIRLGPKMAMIGQGLKQMLKSEIDPANLIFLPSTIYRTSLVRKHLRQAGNYASTRAPQLIWLLLACCEQAKWATVPIAVATRGEPLEQGKTSILPIARGMPLCVELVGDDKDFCAWLRKMTNAWITPNSLGLQLLTQYRLSPERHDRVHPSRAFKALRLAWHQDGFALSLRWRVIESMLLFPSLCQFLIKRFYPEKSAKKYIPIEQRA